MQRTHIHIINGCSRHTSKEDTSSIMKLVGGAEANHSKFLVFIRDPVDRIASQQNNQAQRFGDKKNFEEDVRRLASNVGWSRMLRS